MKGRQILSMCLCKVKNRQLLSVCLVVLAVITAAILCGEDRLIRELRPSPLETSVLPGETVTVQGQVYRVEAKPESQALYLKDNSIQYQKKLFQESRIIIYTDPDLQVDMGNIVRAKGKVFFFQNARNPGNFDQKRYYQIQDIHCQVRAMNVRAVDRCVWKWRTRISVFRNRWKEVLASGLGREDGTTLGAMLLGEKAEMEQELKTLYQVNGIGHILAISGLHLSFMGIGMYKLLRRITGSYPVGGAFGILFLLLYILMIGLTVSAVRALTMFLFRVGADMTGRHYDGPTAFSVAAVVVLLWRPLSLYDGGFWLSFGAVFAILTVVPVLQGWVKRTFPENKGNKRGKSGRISGLYRICVSIVQGCMASIGINLILLPVLLYYFFEFPIYSLFLNLFVIPLMSVLLFMGMAGSLFFVCFLPLSGACFWICGGILRLYEMGCNLALNLPGARFVAGKPEIWQIAAYYGILVIVMLLLREKERLREYVDDVEGTESKKYKTCRRGIAARKHVGRGPGSGMQKNAVRESDVNVQKNAVSKFDAGIQRYMTRLGRFAIMLGMAGIIVLTHRWGERGKLTTVVLDVGQGDGIFMRGPVGGTYLVDGGSSDVKKVGQYRIEPFLKSQGVGMIDYVLISHGDSDHVNGVEELMERQNIGVKIKTLVLPMQEVWDEALAGIAEKAKEYGIRVVVIEPGQSIKEGDMTITCIQPGNPGTEAENRESEGRDADEEYEPGNASSMVLAVKFGEFDMLLTGDVEGKGEEQLTKQLEKRYWDCRWEILKAAHHGSKNSSSEEFLRQVKPAYAFISAGRENLYGHPHQETIERLTDVGSKIYSTQGNGALIVEVEDGETMKVGK
ncbi:ComEC/Rec2 family competence protein [Sporofaciens musculi]|uniref:ComEC/Rec2 family competence protein n=1 Tax=Sporofaciens musculi TaxID=2681861 RepID=UPI002585B74E|nr:ComEC/Rec2 family competence protein [Sporofaciens musculi]